MNRAAVVADLRRHYGVRLHRRSLSSGEVTLPELLAYVEYLPAGSAVWSIEHGLPYGWSLTDVLISDLFQVITGEEHPQRAPITKKARAEDVLRRLEAQRKRLREKGIRT